MKEEKKDERKNKICYEFINKGACTKTGCQFMHFNPNASFPNYPNRRGNMEQKKPENVEHSRKICYNFKNKGFSKYGNTCKFQHERRDYRSDRRNQNKTDNFNSERRKDKRNGPHYNNEKNFFRRNKEHDGGHKGHDQYTEAGSSKSHASSEPRPPKSPLPNCISSRSRSTVLAHGSTRYNVLRGKGEPRRKKVRRGVKRNKSISGPKKCQVLYVNINGYKSKMESVK